MSATRTASLLLSLGWLAVLPAAAEDLPAFSSPGSPVAAVEGAPASAAGDPRGAAPADEAHAVSAAAPQAAAAVADIPPPDVPAVAVVVTPTDGLSGAIALRLADGAAPGSARLPQKQREAIAAFYALGAFKPCGSRTAPSRPRPAPFSRACRPRARTRSTPPITRRPTPGKTALDLADAELKLSAAAVLYARDARGARLDPARLNQPSHPEADASRRRRGPDAPRRRP